MRSIYLCPNHTEETDVSMYYQYIIAVIIYGAAIYYLIISIQQFIIIY